MSPTGCLFLARFLDVVFWDALFVGVGFDGLLGKDELKLDEMF
jgi:hypothetical protein